jgi:hypothetical protein
MNQQLEYRILLLTTAILLSALYFTYAIRSQSQEVSFFSKALHDAGAHEAVTVRGMGYEVTRGMVQTPAGTALEGRKALPVLRLAYTLELARRNPIFDLSGTDPTELGHAIDSLVTMLETARNEQTDPKNAAGISSLYPTQFLRSLGKLEAARVAFIRSGADTEASAYRDALTIALREGRSGIDSFKRTFDVSTAGNTNVRLVGFGNSITKFSIQSAILSIKQRMEESGVIARTRDWCLNGYLSFCDPHNLDVTLPSSTRINDVREDPATQLRIEEIRDLFKETYSNPDVTQEIILSSSVCAASLPGPYQILSGSQYIDLTYPKLMNDLFFVNTTNASHPLFRYLSNNEKISLSLINPLTFYICPEVQADMARVRAILRTAEVAKLYPEVAPVARRKLLAQPNRLYESNAIQYIRAALPDILASDSPQTPESTDAFITLAHMFTNNSAGLENVINQIARINASDLKLKKEKIPFDMRASTLFLTHSALPSLFLAENTSAGNTTVDMRDHQNIDARKPYSEYVRYSEIQTSLPREKILQNMRALYMFEQKGK